MIIIDIWRRHVYTNIDMEILKLPIKLKMDKIETFNIVLLDVVQFKK